MRWNPPRRECHTHASHTLYSLSTSLHIHSQSKLLRLKPLNHIKSKQVESHGLWWFQATVNNKRLRIKGHAHESGIPRHFAAVAQAFEEVLTPYTNGLEICVQKLGNAYQRNERSGAKWMARFKSTFATGIQQNAEMFLANDARFPFTVLACLPWSFASCSLRRVGTESRFLRPLISSRARHRPLLYPPPPPPPLQFLSTGHSFAWPFQVNCVHCHGKGRRTVYEEGTQQERQCTFCHGDGRVRWGGGTYITEVLLPVLISEFLNLFHFCRNPVAFIVSHWKERRQWRSLFYVSREHPRQVNSGYQRSVLVSSDMLCFTEWHWRVS